MKQINNKTWVSSTTDIDKYKSRLAEDSLINPIKKLSRPKTIAHQNNEIIYRRFVKECFVGRKFMSSREFNSLLKSRFNGVTFYRNRMVDLKLITIHNYIVKLNENE